MLDWECDFSFYSKNQILYCCESTFFKLGFTPCKAEPLLQGMKLPEKAQKD